VSVDGTDFRVYEPSFFSKKWFSHKFTGPGIRYEVALCIQTGWIVWINGPFPCGDWPDLRIAREALVDALDRGEYYIADGGYYDGNQWSETPTGLNNFEQRQQKMVRSRHETVNSRLKQWSALNRVFRHRLSKHSPVFRAVANILQLSIENGEPLFEIEYDDNDT
jgi:hypothetical protein